MNDTERAAIDAWMAERDIKSLAELESHIANLGDERFEDGLSTVPECDAAHAEDVYEDEALAAGLAQAIEDAADDITREAKDGTLWLHSLPIARRLLEHPRVAAAFGEP